MGRSLDLLTDACAGLAMTVRKMFGGHGFFAPNGGMFAGIVTDDEVIFKLADEAAKAELVSLGGHPWTYDGQGKPMTMASWIVVPQGFYDDPEAFAAWARRAHALAPPKAAKAKPPRERSGRPAAARAAEAPKAQKAKSPRTKAKPTLTKAKSPRTKAKPAPKASRRQAPTRRRR